MSQLNTKSPLGDNIDRIGEYVNVKKFGQTGDYLIKVEQKENIDISIIDRLEKMEAYDREVDKKLKTISDFENKINNLSEVLSTLVNNASDDKNYKIYGENDKK